MEFIDLWEEEYMHIRGPIIERLDEIPSRKLKASCQAYRELDQKSDILLEEHVFVCNLIENNLPDKDTLTKEDMNILRDFFDIARTLDNYERLEIYKLGFHDCITWLKMIGIL